MTDLAPGAVIEVAPYPFVRTTAIVNEDGGEGGVVEIETWRPGCKRHFDEWTEAESCSADGNGAMLLSIVSTHKPGRYPARVFYTRQWRDPDGKVFGRQHLRIISRAAFAQMARGYRHPYELDTAMEHVEDKKRAVLDGLAWADQIDDGEASAKAARWFDELLAQIDAALAEQQMLPIHKCEPTEAQNEEYELLCNGEWVAGASGEGAMAEIAHYLTQYEQDGECEVYAVTRRLVDRAAFTAKE